MKHALVTRNIVDLRAEPDFRAERKTQALFGERLRTHASERDYTDVEQLDGYRGWTRSAGLVELDENDWEKMENAPGLSVVSPIATVMDGSGAPIAPYFLSYGSTVYPAEDEGDSATPESDILEITSSDGLCRTVYKEDLCRVSPPGDHNPDDLAESIICSCVQFLGAPYIWGGRSALGLDCSALVQLVYGMHGVTLPRDTRDQCLAGQKVERGYLQPGDLIFSPGHVVIYMGDDEYIHASLSEGGVEINSYDPSSHNYRKDLDEDYQIARRLW